VLIYGSVLINYCYLEILFCQLNPKGSFIWSRMTTFPWKLVDT